jgi:hypothetical protein
LGKFYQIVAEELVLYAQQLGWFHAVPESKNVNQSSKKTRIEEIVDAGREPKFPDVGEAGYMAEYWHEAGMVGSGFSGAVPLTSQDVNAWSDAMGIRLSPWEHATIKLMSRGYVKGLNDGAERDSIAPMGASVVEHDLAGVSKRISKLLKSFVRKN